MATKKPQTIPHGDGTFNSSTFRQSASRNNTLKSCKSSLLGSLRACRVRLVAPQVRRDVIGIAAASPGARSVEDAARSRRSRRQYL